MRSIGMAALCVLLAGCAASPQNPAFPVKVSEAHADLDRMRQHPVVLQRPLVIIGGFGDPNISPPLFAHHFETITEHATIIPVSVGLCGSFDECRKAVIDAVDKACPNSDPMWTSEVDVLGVSLGGLVGRYSAAPPFGRDQHPMISERRLRIARLFTISSPLSGAKLADNIALTQFHRDMRNGSDFLNYLAGQDASASYELYPYVHLDDEIVGDYNAAPVGQNAYWLPNVAPLLPHAGAVLDERILADISRRLRGETPFTHPPAGPLPEVANFDSPKSSS